MTTDVATGADLAAGLSSSDPDAWELLYRRSYGRLLAYARRRLPTEEQAREAVSETLVRAVSGRHRFRNSGAGPEAWLYGILRHVVLDAQRRLARRAPIAPAVMEELGPDPAEHQMEAEDRAAIRAAFIRLNRADQELLELRVVAGLPVEEVAVVLGRSPAAIRMAQSRALGRLRRILGVADAGEGEDVRVGA